MLLTSWRAEDSRAGISPIRCGFSMWKESRHLASSLRLVRGQQEPSPLHGRRHTWKMSLHRFAPSQEGYSWVPGRWGVMQQWASGLSPGRPCDGMPTHNCKFPLVHLLVYSCEVFLSFFLTENQAKMEFSFLFSLKMVVSHSRKIY